MCQRAFLHADQWHDLVISKVDSDGVTVTEYELKKETYVSNWIPLWAGVTQPQCKVAVAASNSFTSSGEELRSSVLQAVAAMNHSVSPPL